MPAGSYPDAKELEDSDFWMRVDPLDRLVLDLGYAKKDPIHPIKVGHKCWRSRCGEIRIELNKEELEENLAIRQLLSAGIERGWGHLKNKYPILRENYRHNKLIHTFLVRLAMVLENTCMFHNFKTLHLPSHPEISTSSSHLEVEGTK